MVVAAAAVIVLAQPTRGPWWTYADADAAYSASALALLDGKPTRYLDHPGLPLQQALEAALGVQWLASGHGRHGWVRETLYHLDDARLAFRGLAAAFYLLGATLTFALVSRLAGGPLWGLLGGLLWVAAPGLVAMSIQYRPDVLLSALCLLCGFLLVRAAESRRTGSYVLAALAIGFTATVKLHAVALVAVLVLTYALRAPQVTFEARGWARRHRRALAVGATSWLALALVLNAPAFPPRPSAAQLAIGAVLVAAMVLAIVLARRGMAWAQVLVGLLVGVAIPVTLTVRDGLQALVSMAKTVSGQNVNAGISPFENLSRLGHSPLREAVLVFALAAAAAVYGLIRREPAPVVLFAASAALAAFALARLADVHYFAPPFLLAVAAALWFASRLGAAGVVGAVVLTLVVAVPAFRDRDAPAHDAAAFRARAEPGLAAAATRLRAGEVALTPDYYPNADVRWFDLVRPYAPFDEYPYRFLPAATSALELARARRLRVAFGVDVSPEALVALGLRTGRREGPLLTLEDDQAPEG